MVTCIEIKRKKISVNKRQKHLKKNYSEKNLENRGCHELHWAEKQIFLAANLQLSFMKLTVRWTNVWSKVSFSYLVEM